RPAADVLPVLLKSPHPNITQRAALIRSYTNYLLDPPLSLEPLLDYMLGQGNEAVQVKQAALEGISTPGFRVEGKAKDKLDKPLLSLVEEKEAAMRLGVIKAIEETRLAKAAPKLVALLGDGDRPGAERAAAARALRVFGEKSAVPALKAVLTDGKAEE